MRLVLLQELSKADASKQHHFEQFSLDKEQPFFFFKKTFAFLPKKEREKFIDNNRK